jgi:hypothetical protein
MINILWLPFVAAISNGFNLLNDDVYLDTLRYLPYADLLAANRTSKAPNPIIKNILSASTRCIANENVWPVLRLQAESVASRGCIEYLQEHSKYFSTVSIAGQNQKDITTILSALNRVTDIQLQLTSLLPSDLLAVFRLLSSSRSVNLKLLQTTWDEEMSVAVGNLLIAHNIIALSIEHPKFLETETLHLDGNNVFATMLASFHTSNLKSFSLVFPRYAENSAELDGNYM